MRVGCEWMRNGLDRMGLRRSTRPGGETKSLLRVSLYSRRRIFHQNLRGKMGGILWFWYHVIPCSATSKVGVGSADLWGLIAQDPPPAPLLRPHSASVSIHSGGSSPVGDVTGHDCLGVIPRVGSGLLAFSFAVLRVIALGCRRDASTVAQWGAMSLLVLGIWLFGMVVLVSSSRWIGILGRCRSRR